MPRKTIKALESELSILQQLRSGDQRNLQAMQDERNRVAEDNKRGGQRLAEANGEIRFLRETVTLLVQALRTGA